jgi:SNF2 family DNA or RNA helicase
VGGSKRVRVRESLIKRIDRQILLGELVALSQKNQQPKLPLKAKLYPYQKKGVAFGLFKPGVLIGDEMGLGKTLQAISLGILKKELFGFSKVLIITLASLKEQWKREIEKFTHEKAVIVEGNPAQRQNIYAHDDSFFKITNYEAVLRDVLVLSRFNPDLIVLDEAQRIKNFSTKTADAVKSIPKKHALVLTGTPLENKLEDVYSIVQFLDPYLLTPLWRFAADHYLIPIKKKSSVGGYKNLDKLKEKLKSIVIRRKKEEVLQDLPREVVNNYYVDLTEEQSEIHGGYARVLLPLLNKKFLTPVDVRRIQMLLLKMRQVCDSTYLIDRETHISPKLKELEGILDEIVVQNQRKMVIFSEWTTMTYLIAKTLSDMNIAFVELSGKVPVKKRQALIDAFTNNPECRVFLSTDAGGTGLNLQAADSVVNFELPWNPAKMNQRVGRINRIGQASKCINVVNLIAKNSIEEKIFATIQLKTDLFKGVFDDGPDTVEFSKEKRNEMLNRLREMMGEEPEPLAPEPGEPEEIPEDTPYYLNPEILNKEDEEAEERKDAKGPEGPRETAEPIESSESGPGTGPEVRETPAAEETAPGGSDTRDREPGNILAGQSPEKVETVLNSGMQFMAGLMEMATGQKMEKSGDQDKMITIDRDTGEVTMKFKLPGF